MVTNGLIPRSLRYTHLGTDLQVLLTRGATHTQTGPALRKAHKHQHTGDPCEHRTSLMTRGHTLVQPSHHPITHRTGTHRCRETDGGQDWISATLGPLFFIRVAKTQPRRAAGSSMHPQGHCGQVWFQTQGTPISGAPPSTSPRRGLEEGKCLAPGNQILEKSPHRNQSLPCPWPPV